MKHVFLGLLFVLCSITAPRLGMAQYKNMSLGIDLGLMTNLRPTLLDSQGNVLRADRRPLRIASGARLGVETNFKLDADHWWLTTRLNVSLAQFGGLVQAKNLQERQFDSAANDAVGTLLGLEGQLGVRYYILTDHIRPYIGTGISYLHWFTFANTADSSCGAVTPFCDGEASNQAAYLPHTNILSLHLEPGIEFVVARDIALKLSVDLHRWIIFNAPDTNGMVSNIGIVFFM